MLYTMAAWPWLLKPGQSLQQCWVLCQTSARQANEPEAQTPKFGGPYNKDPTRYYIRVPYLAQGGGVCVLLDRAWLPAVAFDLMVAQRCFQRTQYPLIKDYRGYLVLI